MKVDCPKFEDCSAPLCPLDESSLKNGVWYPGIEEVCKRKDFQNLGWIGKQRAIAKAKAPSDKYFRVLMLQAIKQIRRGIEGINPDQPLEEAKEAERKWTAAKKGGRLIANESHKVAYSIAKKRKELIGATSTSHQDRGGQK